MRSTPLDTAFDNWSQNTIRSIWEHKNINIRDGKYCVISGKDYQAKPKEFPVQIDRTGDVYHAQKPIVGLITSIVFLYLTFIPHYRVNNIPITARTVTAFGNAGLAFFHAVKDIQKVWEHWGDSQYSKKSAFSKTFSHGCYAFKHIGIVAATGWISDHSFTLSGYNFAHMLAIATIFSFSAYNPLQVRVWANNTISTLDMNPVSETKFAQMSLLHKGLAICDGSYSLLRILGMERIGNKDIDKTRIEIIDKKK